MRIPASSLALALAAAAGASPAGFVAQAYPNPANPADAVTLLVRTPGAGPATWELPDAVGRAVAHGAADLPAGATTLPLPQLGGLATGAYLLHVRQGARQQVIRLVRR